MKAEFSEFSYGFAVTDELINWRGTNITAAPYFPSLIEEGSVGYDLRLDRPGLPLFIQFKRSEYISRVFSSSQESQNGVFYNPFYRMHLRSLDISQQHELLCDLETIGNEVQYIAPFFWQETEFNSYFLNKDVCNNSVFVSPLEIGRITDYEKHHISFQNLNQGYRFSEPVRLENPLTFEHFTTRIIRKLETQEEQKNYGIDYWTHLSEDLEKIIREARLSSQPFLYSFENIEKIQNPLERVSILSQTYFGSQFFITRFKENEINESEKANIQNPIDSIIR